MREFKNVAKLVKTSRINHPKEYSQSDLSTLLGYKNGQFVSNVERALCSIPLKMLVKVSTILNIPKDDLVGAIQKDNRQTVLNFLAEGERVEQTVRKLTKNSLYGTCKETIKE